MHRALSHVSLICRANFSFEPIDTTRYLIYELKLTTLPLIMSGHTSLGSLSPVRKGTFVCINR